MTHEMKSIQISLLEINIENPRFEMADSQREAISAMIEDQKNKLANIAQDIIENGLNPSDLISVLPHDENRGRFRVLEGNRRVTALKLLSNNNLIPNEYKSLRNKFKKLSDKFKGNPIKEILCVVFLDIDEANKWIKLKHTGENEGIGTVPWNAQQKARFEERVGGKATRALQVIDFLTADDKFDDELKGKLSGISSSNLDRLLSDPDIIDLIGLKIEKGRIVSSCSSDEIRKPLTKIIADLCRDDFKVKEIYYKEDRENYIETFKSSELPDKTVDVGKWELTTPNPIVSSEKNPRKSKPLSFARNTVIPKDFIVSIGIPRINDIYRELKKLDLQNFVNSAAITLRVFIELSVDEFIESHRIDCKDDKLSKKIGKVADYLKENQSLTREELKPIRTAISNPHSIFSVDTFHA
ncbi:MAG: hypothetical protein LGR52_14115 [Candidatus Thiosymbion ectosymbiont of Robbea hypermnestra]|nr:hypothetical protein [Candidatus Thiosymbion ectosymbiont of Robbea hypermnestra]